jgi:hypothetical protein
MENKVVGIEALYGAAWSDAVMNVMEVLNETLGLELNWLENGNQISTICTKLGIKFDINGNIVK